MTGYVATRWYRAPEIMLNWMHYNQNGAVLSNWYLFIQLFGSLFLKGCLLKCFYMWAEALNFWCFSSSWYLVSGVHYGRAAEGKGPFSRHWLYPLHAWKESTAAAAIFYPSRLQPSITSLKCLAEIKMCIAISGLLKAQGREERSEEQCRAMKKKDIELTRGLWFSKLWVPCSQIEQGFDFSNSPICLNLTCSPKTSTSWRELWRWWGLRRLTC